jgi:hypothetical protein
MTRPKLGRRIAQLYELRSRFVHDGVLDPESLNWALETSRSMVVAERTVETFISSIFMKLDLPAEADDHRRVLAVLAWLQR